MKRITDLAAFTAEKHQISQRKAEAFISAMIDVMGDALRDEKQLKIRGLGTFKVSAVNARQSVSVSTGERIVIGERAKISFSPENSMRDLVNKPFAQFETVVVNEGVNFDAIDEKYKNSLSGDIEPEEKEMTPTTEAVMVEVAEDITNPITNKNQNSQTNREKEEPMENEMRLDDYGYPIKENEEVKELTAKLKSKSRLVKLLAAVICCLVVIAFGGYFYMNNLLKERDKRIEHLVAQIQEDQHNTHLHAMGMRPDDVRPGRPPRRPVEKGQSDKERADAQLAEHERKVKEREIALKAEELKHQEALNAKREELAKAEAAKKAALQAEQAKLAAQKASQQSKPQVAKPANVASAGQSAVANADVYNRDPRVRLGAYVITGVSETVTVREGQTLAGISKAYLGPGMECYVEAVNGGIKEVKPGQKLKIPSVKVKKSVSKQKQ